MEDFKRPLHADFATSSELKERQFSGIRINSITDEQELWTFGDMRFAVSLSELHRDPTIWDKKYEEAFKLHDVQTLSQH